MTGGNNGKYYVDDIAYQGNSYESANAYGIVLSWSANTGKLALGAVQGQFKVDNTIRGLSSNAAYQLDSFDVAPLKLSKITIEPDPLTAEPGDDYGFTTEIQEWPDINE